MKNVIYVAVTQRERDGKRERKGYGGEGGRDEFVPISLCGKDTIESLLFVLFVLFVCVCVYIYSLPYQ